ncbi:uncharacterized protein LOC112086114 [Eutrema salsugineum]|uniref:uncharacterized protein LOC112086114 n=1 Tax=Eutrema salsugineum TaxID=72664 RepID=UPI000CED7DEA|nr:uncharacterized protein LOC112086114 [Eutrema salsugineum]
MVRQCNLIDMGYHGPWFTWCNKRQEGLIHKKLDRVLVNEEWLLNHPYSYSVFKAGGVSDHLRGRFYLSHNDQRTKKSFKFLNALAKMPEFLPAMESFCQRWRVFASDGGALGEISGTFSFDISYAPSHQKVKELETDSKAFEELCKKQEANATNPSQEALAAALTKWEHLYELEEAYLKQKSKLHWINVGDKSNKIFFRAVCVRESQNLIKKIVDKNGNVLKDPVDIKAEAEKHFSDFLTDTPKDFQGIETEDLENLLDIKCNTFQCEQLTREVTEDEIKQFDWEAAVREIDLACLKRASNTSSSSNHFTPSAHQPITKDNGTKL